jgi:RNA polymerase sigma-70 factor (ECF subfamily)
MNSGADNYRRFLSGDKEGLADIIRYYRDGLTLYIYSIVGNIGIAEELMEDTFVRLYVYKPKYSGKSSFKTWLYSIGKHIAADYIRRNSRIKHISSETVLDVADEANLEADTIKSEESKMLHKAIQRLKPEYEQVLYLSYFENFSNKETAAIMKKTTRQVENLLYNAKKALKNELEKEGYVYENL